MYKLGIDVGGTNTDAVLIDENLRVVASVKRHTTPDAYDGILDAVRAVLEESGVDRREIGQAMLGTTQCTNAIVERRHLAPIGVLRIGAPATVGIPPMVDWAEDLRSIAVDTAVIGGGFEYDGKELAPFDEEAARAFFQGLKAKGVRIGAVTLHVGLGTFRPVSVEKISEHKMHSEHYHLSAETAALIQETKQNGGRVIAVGTTSCRTLESVAAKEGRICESDGWTDIFIYPGYEFKVLDGLITNFHLPESTLVMLVSALAGRENILHAYQVAVEEKYRFFSFGDAMFIK